MQFRPISRRPFAVVEVHRKAEAVLDIWEELETVAPASFYQTRAFVIPWLETLGAARKVSPLFIAAKDGDARAIILLCLGVRKIGPLRIAGFLGDKASNFDMPLWRPEISWTREDLAALLRAAADLLGPAAPDVFALREQPFAWRGRPNPLALLPYQPSPHTVPATKLEPDSKKYFAAKLSANARRKLRQHESRLADLLGPVELISNDTPTRADTILSAFFAQRTVRFREQGIDADFSHPAMRAFWTQLARPSTTPAAVEFYALVAGGQIAATAAGAAHAGCFSGTVNSIDTRPEVARMSPGTLLFNKLLAVQCEKKVTQFDCGPGDADYKLRYCDETIALFDVFVPVRFKGWLFAQWRGQSLQLKRLIKQNPQLFEWLRNVKRALVAKTLLCKKSQRQTPEGSAVAND
jgi:CelD/BcsL family acetyltransferase involved in cellulose biosynthesis